MTRSWVFLTAFCTCSISLHANATQFGRTNGNFAVLPDGSASYVVPIKVPPGVAGLQPSLSLSYDSRNGDGLLGIGWSLNGLSAISRCNLTYAQDSLAGSPQLTSSDRFCLDGNRLRTTNGSTYGAAGATYQTEIADFSLVTSNGTAGSGPASFTVKGKNGLTYQYGNSTDSAILATGSSSFRTWALHSVTDRNGNSMTYTYTNDTTDGSYRIASIQYTNTGGSTTNNMYSVSFAYLSRPSSDVAATYKIGAVNNQLYYLNQITVTLLTPSSTMVHGYTLTYATSPTTSRMRISSIQECASSFSDCFPATTIGYQNGSSGWGSEVASSGNVTNMAYAMPIDVNGDGIDDLVYPDPSSGHWYYELGTASGTYSGPYDTGQASTNYQSALAIDFYANGKKDILVPNSSGNWRVLQYVSGTGAFSYVDTSTSAAGVVPGSAFVGDVDGDGREDLIYAVSGGTGYAQPDYIYYRLNTGGAFSTTQGTLASFPNGAGCNPCVKLGNTEPFGNPGYRFLSQVRKLDFNGDGRTDFLVYLGSCSPDPQPSKCGTTYPITYSWTIFLSQPNGTYVSADAVHYAIGSTPNQPPLVGDFNGDGCSDIAVTESNTWYLEFGTCGRSGVTNVLATAVNTGIAYVASPVLAVDWDGDGRTDLLEPKSASSGDWWVARSTGSTLNALVDTGIPTEGASVVQTSDLNGDGQPDLVYMVSNALKTRPHNGTGVQPDLVTSIVDAYGNSVSPSYVSLARATDYTATNDQTYPNENYLGPLYVVSAVTFSDPTNAPSGTYQKQYSYTGAALNLQGRGFTGFATFDEYDSRNGIWDTKDYDRAFPYIGMMTSETASQNSANTLPIRTVTRALTNLTLDSTANNQRYFPYSSSDTVNSYEVGGALNAQLITTTVRTYATPDSYGNYSSIATSLTDKDPNSPYLNEVWTSTIATSYTEDGSSNWCLTQPTERDVTYTAPGVASITRHVSYTPDYSHCRETQQVVESGNATYQVTDAFGYDSFGNLNTQTVTGIGMAARETQINWGTSGQFPTYTINALGQQTNVSFDPITGQQSSQTDPNGITVSWAYDTFGRKIQTTNADGTATTWAYNSCATAVCVNANNQMTVVQTLVNTKGAAIHITNAYLDALDRTLVTSDQMLSGAFNRIEVQYDNLGNIHEQFAPCNFTSCTSYVTTNTYDILNRLTQSQRPISASNSTLQYTNYAYQGRKFTITDPYGHTKTTITDVNGWLRQTTDALGYYVTRAYDSAGSLIGITDSAGNSLLKSVTYAYGIKPFLLAATDADRGAWVYTVDALGERTGWTDAKGQAFSMTYDALSRPLTRTEPDLFSQWTYGSTPASHNVGQLISECAGTSGACTTSGYAENRTFDSLGRLSTRSITQNGNGGNDPGGVFLFTYTYDATTGYLSTLKYPLSTAGSGDPLTLQYGYAYGLLQTVTDTGDTTATCGSSCTLWTANAMNAFGQVTQETLGNGVVMNRTYDNVTSWLSAATAGVGGGATLLNQSYLEDENGNIIQRQNNNQGLTESFAYDTDNRLTCTALASTCTTPTIAYDGGAAGPGNITSQSGLGTYTYPAAGQPRPHAVTSITGTFNGIVNPTFSYDANGNMTGRASATQNVFWMSFNYPSSISATDATGSEEVQFSYGPDRQRWKQIYTGPSGTENTYYIGGLMDKVHTGTTDYRHYIYAGNEPIAIYSRTSTGGVTMRYFLDDHQGSLSTIASNSGAVDVNESFSAFGTRRNPATWSGAPTTSDLNTIAGLSRQGYTFQTWLGQSMGLNHMNGRVEDAILGRFMSPDPHVTDPTNAQSYNRYSYVVNNPLTLADPSGFCYTGGRAPCVNYGGGKRDRSNVIGSADTARSLPGALQAVDAFAAGADSGGIPGNDTFLFSMTAPSTSPPATTAAGDADANVGSGNTTPLSALTDENVSPPADAAAASQATSADSSPGVSGDGGMGSGGGADSTAQSQMSGDQLAELTVTAQRNSFNDPLVFDPTTAVGQYLQMANRGGTGFWSYTRNPDNPYHATAPFQAQFDGSPLEVAVTSTMLMIQAGSYPIREALTGGELQLPGGDGALYYIYTVGPPDSPLPGQRIANVPGSNTFYYSPYHYNPGPGVPNAYVQFTLGPN